MRNKQADRRPLEERLRAAPPGFRAPDALADRVMANLPDRPMSQRSDSRPLPLLPRFALGLAMFALIAVVLLQSPAPKPSPAVSTPPSGESSPEVVEVSVPSLQIAPFQKAQFQNLPLQLDRPLEKELQNVISDTRQAIQFVASSFLPEK